MKTNVFFYDVVGISNAAMEDLAEEIADIFKVRELDRTRMVKPISNYRARHKIKAGENSEVPYEEACMETRKLFMPYNAVMICYSDTDQRKLAEMMSDKSLIIAVDRGKTKIGRYKTDKGVWKDRWIQVIKEYTPAEYINMKTDEHIEDKTYGISIMRRDGDDNRTIDDIYKYNRQCDIFGTDQLHIRKNQDSVMNQWYLEATCGGYKNEFHTGKNHFDLEQEDEVIETYEMSKSAKDKLAYASVSLEKAMQDIEYIKEVKKWLHTLEATNKKKWKKARKLYYGNKNLKACECCRTVYDNNKIRCPICHIDNETCPIDATNELPWIQLKLHGLDSETKSHN